MIIADETYTAAYILAYGDPDADGIVTAFGDQYVELDNDVVLTDVELRQWSDHSSSADVHHRKAAAAYFINLIFLLNERGLGAYEAGANKVMLARLRHLGYRM